MNILYLCHRFPYPPKRGGKIRPFNMIRHLSAKGHRVTVCSLARSAAEAHEAAGIASYCAAYELVTVRNPVQVVRMLTRLPTRTPSSMGFFYSADLRQRVNRLLNEQTFDLIFVHCSSMAQYVEDVDDVIKVLDFGDMDSQKWLEYGRFKPFPFSLGYRLEGIKLEAAEKGLCKKFDLCTATTRAEWETLESYGTAKATAWFPNGVDTDYFRPEAAAYDPYTLSFVGRMDYYPNQECMFDFCRRVLPIIQARQPKTKLLIVGAEPTPAVRRLARMPGVTVTGSVPDVRPYVLRSAAMVAPLNIARGTQNKILEAMAMGVPVVTSPQAARGVDAEYGVHFIVASNPRDYAEACLMLMADGTERARLGAAGRARMTSNHNWENSMLRLDAILERVLPGYARVAAVENVRRSMQ